MAWFSLFLLCTVLLQVFAVPVARALMRRVVAPLPKGAGILTYPLA